MKQIAIVTLALVGLGMVAGCVNRINIYSPRRSNTEAHREARTAADCLDCHDVKGIRYHDEDDDCLRCHAICWEY